MYQLNEKQFEEIKRINNTVNQSRDYVIELLCDVLSAESENEFYMYRYCGRANSWVVKANASTDKEIKIEVETFRFANPTSYAIKALYIHDCSDHTNTFHFFDWYGNRLPKRMTRRQEEEYKRNQIK